MRFDVVPAVDVSGGRIAAFSGEGIHLMDVFDSDPVVAGRAFAQAGARWLHVVDLDLAVHGEPANLTVVEELAGMPGVRVQAAGGVRSDEEVQAFLAAGADRVVLGSAVLGDPDLASFLMSRFGTRVVLGIEVDGGRIRSRGRDPVDLDLMSTLGWAVQAGAARFLVTAVGRVASLEGPDVSAVRRVVRVGRPVVAAGGVTTHGHLTELRDAGACGAVIGRAALEGELDLAAAVRDFTV
jgi:phosphoribosylformimino-5-aminoimidazole carboxamide ribotide isomerase